LHKNAPNYHPQKWEGRHIDGLIYYAVETITQSAVDGPKTSLLEAVDHPSKPTVDGAVPVDTFGSLNAPPLLNVIASDAVNAPDTVKALLTVIKFVLVLVLVSVAPFINSNTLCTIVPRILLIIPI
jgi:hypothetical protein